MNSLRAPFRKKAIAGVLLVSLASLAPVQAASAATPKGRQTAEARSASIPSYSANLAAGSETVTPDWIGAVANGLVDAVAGGVAGAYAAAKFASPAAEVAAAESSSSSSSSSSGNAQIYSGISGNNLMDVQFDAVAN